MDAFWRDLRFALRGLGRSPAFTAIAVLTLALGIGANTAIFSVVNAVLLRPLAYAEPDRLVALSSGFSARGVTNAPISAPELNDYRREVDALQDASGAWPININLTGYGEPERIAAAVVSPNFFSVLGVPPALGRDFTNADAGGRIGYVALISYELWQRRFGGDPSAIGKTVRLDDDPMTIIGVMPKGFRHPIENTASPLELWAPIDLTNPDPDFVNNRQARVLSVVGRMKPGRTVAEVQRSLDALRDRWYEQYPDAYSRSAGWRADVLPLPERLVGKVRPALLILLGAVGCVLLIGCANVANLLLARATTRGREIAIRTAMGGTRRSIIRQLLTESLVLAALGGALGLLIAVWGTSALSDLAAVYLPRAREIGIDRPVLAFTAALILVTGVGFGLLPALQASRPDLQSVLKDSGKGMTAGARRNRLRSGLVVLEVALALVLLAGAGLLLRSFERLVRVEPGFNPDGLLTLQIWLPWPNAPEKGRYFTPRQRLGFYDRTVAAVEAVPGARQVALAAQLPLRGQNEIGFDIVDRPVDPDEPSRTAEFRPVTANYFEAMEIPLIRGRTVGVQSDSTAPVDAVINRTMAAKYWPNEDPVGRQLRLFGPKGPLANIVGVVGDVRQVRLDLPAKEEIFVSMRRFTFQQAAFVIRTDGRPDELAGAVTRAIRTVDPEQPIFGVMPMTRVLADAGAERRFSLLLLTLFAGIAFVLSVIGIYGVMAYATSQRRHEIGIRMALGAGSREVLGLVLGQGMRLVGIGLVLGLSGAWALSRVLTSQLYGVSARDPLTYLTVAMLLGAVALAASYLPARRAMRVDPMSSLRSE
ncbi:MAG TPA: ABC transporter permease [Gemmatimonadales bacterium]|nr:ABC transporter permease [Gemmatimonadales bacterium]